MPRHINLMHDIAIITMYVCVYDDVVIAMDYVFCSLREFIEEFIFRYN